MPSAGINHHQQFDKFVDTVVVGSGPSALILSYILSGHEPVVRPSAPHPDAALQNKLSSLTSLFDADVNHLTSHFYASRYSYSIQALLVNVLLDTLLRPLGDTEPGFHESCIEWKATGKRVEHVVLGRTAEAGGQWQENPVKASWGIGTLSYAELLSLPGYGIEEHLRKKGREVCDFLRPDRREVADYLRQYPQAVGIEENLRGEAVVGDVRRIEDGFYIGSHGLRCKHLVLASGTFSRLTPPRPPLKPLLQLPELPEEPTEGELPLLIVGSGFSAADLIITHLPKRKIIHIFKWDPVDCASPLRACHPQAYPEYASVYRRMKVAAKTTLGDASIASPMARRKSNPFFDNSQLEINYEGLPNTWIQEASVTNGKGEVLLELPNGELVRREISGLQYVIGRRGSLEYLDKQLQEEVLGAGVKADIISGRTLRRKVEESTELAPNVFAIGSLVGDSLIRHAYGSCVLAAGEIVKRQSRPASKASTNGTAVVAIPEPKNDYLRTNGHEDLGLWKSVRRRMSSPENEVDDDLRKKRSRFADCVLA